MKEYRVKVYDDRTEWYNLKDELHREDGPAIESTNGFKGWYLNGQRHRKDSPAIEYADGTKEWYKNDKLHREDGPAIEYTNGAKEWYINGTKLTENEFKQRTQHVVELTMDEVIARLGYNVKIKK